MAKHGKKTLRERISSFFKPVERSRKKQVDRQMDIDKFRESASATFKNKSSRKSGAAADVEAARKKKKKKKRKRVFGKVR